MNKTASIRTLINGVASEFLSVNDRSIHYGDGLFETILCDARHLYYWHQHFQRLRSSAEKLKLECPEATVFLSDIASLLNEYQIDGACVLKIILTRGESERGYSFSKKSDVNRIVMISKLDAAYSSLLSNKLLSGNLFLCEQQASINKNLAGLKHLNRLENVMARNEWGVGSADANIIDGLMVNANRHVIEGSMSNLFAVKGDKLYTPELSFSGINGIMRDMIIDLAVNNKIDLSIVNLEIEELFSMDELFITNSLIGMKSVSCFENTEYNYQQITNIIFDNLLNTMSDYAQVV